MAYVQETEDPNAPQSTSTQGAAMNQLPQTSSGSGAGAGAANTTASGSPQGAPAVPNSTQAPPVQNLQAYLAANAPQAVQMGQNIAGNLTQQSNQVTGDINADQAAFDQSVQASNTAPNVQLVDQAASNPSQFVQDPNNVAAFQAQENANYTGPANFESSSYYTPLNTEVQNAVNNAPNINEPYGVQQLVTGQEQNPTVGEENLDSLLLEQSPQALAPIAAAEAPYANLGTALTNAAGTEDASVAQAQANDAAAPALVNSTFLTGPNAVVPAWEQGLQNELTSAQTGTNTYNQDVASQIAEYNQLFPIINSYEAQNPQFTNLGAPPTLQQSDVNAPTLPGVATPQDYQTEAALSQLLGSSLGSTPIDQSTASEAGTYQVPQYNPADIQSYLNPLAENAVTDVAGLFPNAAQPSDYSQSPALRASEELADLGPNADPRIAQLESFLGQLSGSKNAPSDLESAASNQSLVDYLNNVSGGHYGGNLSNEYAVS